MVLWILHHLSHGAHHALFVIENMGIMDYMANGTEYCLASLQAICNHSISQSCGIDQRSIVAQ